MPLIRSRSRMTLGAPRNALDHNVAGNGTTDDTAALQALFDLGGSIYLPRAIYRTTGQLTVSGTNTVIRGDGYPVILKSGNYAAISVTGNGCVLDGLYIEGNTNGGSGISISGYINTVRNCTSRQNGAYGIFLDGTAGQCHDNLIESSRAEINGGIGISAYLSTNNRIVDNWVNLNGQNGILIGNGSHRCVVTGNQIVANCQSGGNGGIGWDGSNWCTVSSNVIQDTGNFQPGIRQYNTSGSSQLSAIVGNILVGNQGGGILLQYSSPHASYHNTFSANVFHLNLLAGTTVDKTIVIDANCADNHLKGNIYFGVAPIDNGTGTVLD